jgi:hypothetical protein
VEVGELAADHECLGRPSGRLIPEHERPCARNRDHARLDSYTWECPRFLEEEFLELEWRVPVELDVRVRRRRARPRAPAGGEAESVRDVIHGGRKIISDRGRSASCAEAHVPTDEELAAKWRTLNPGLAPPLELLE